MAFQITTNDPTGTAPITQAYAKIGLISLDILSGTGRIEIAVFRDAAASSAHLAAVDRFGVALGGEVVRRANSPDSGVTMETLTDFMADPDFAAAFNVIRTKLYTSKLAQHPRLAKAVNV